MSSRSAVITSPLRRAWPGARHMGPMQAGTLLAVLVVAAITGYLVFQAIWGSGQTTAPGYAVATATRTTVVSAVSASGTVDPTREVKLAFSSGGQVAKVDVKQGDTVQAGQEIASLDATALQIRRDTAQSQLNAAQAHLQSLLDAPAAADVAAQQQAVASAQATLANAQSTLQNLLDGVTPDDLAAARANLDSAKAALDAAQANYDKLANGQDLTLRPEYSALNTAKAAYQTALTNYTDKLNPNPSDVAAAQTAVQSAQSALDASKAKLAQLQNPNPVDVTAAQAALQSAQAQLDTAKANYAAVYIGAPLADRQAAQAAVTAAQANLDAAMQKRSALGGSSGPADFAAADAAVAQAQATLQQAQTAYSKLLGQQSGADVDAAAQAVHSAESAVADAQNNLDKLLHPAEADLSAAQQLVTQAQSTLDTARSNLDKLTNPNPDDVAALKATLDNTKAALDTAQTNWDRLVSNVDLPQSPEAIALASAQSNYKSALATWTLKSSPPKPGDVSAAQANVDSARTALAAAQTRLQQVQAGALPTDIEQAREEVNQMQLALNQAQSDLDGATLRAPFAGTITAVNVNEGDLMGAGGGTASSTSAGTTGSSSGGVATLVDPNLVQVDATLDETSVEKVKTGQPVTITFDALPGQTFQGQVAVVTPSGVTQQGVVTFPVTIVFNPQGQTIPTGATASVRIVTDQKNNTIAVPSRAIQRQGRETVVQVVLPDGKLESRQVQVGLTGDNAVEIVSGLSEGEKVAIPSLQSAGQTSGTFGAGGLPGLGAPVVVPRGR